MAQDGGAFAKWLEEAKISPRKPSADPLAAGIFLLLPQVLRWRGIAQECFSADGPSTESRLSPASQTADQYRPLRPANSRWAFPSREGCTASP